MKPPLGFNKCQLITDYKTGPVFLNLGYLSPGGTQKPNPNPVQVNLATSKLHDTAAVV